jgi:hypothetical protein
VLTDLAILLSLPLIMVCGQSLSDELQGAILNMAWTLDINSIITNTGCRKQTIKQVLSDYHKQGTVMCENLTKELRGAKQSLTVADMRVSLL